jgi:hypothetical protein
MLPYRIHKYLFLLLAAAGLMTQLACKKNSNGPAPSISRLRAISPAPNDSALTAALPGQIVVIQGANLSATSQVYFNGFAAALNTALSSDKNLVVRIPSIAWDSIPSGKLNTVEVVTPGGAATYKFTITPPLPTVTAISNEMALAGATITLTGTSFYGVTQVIFPGGIAVSNLTLSGITKITLTVPAGVTTGGPLQLIGTYGTGTSIPLFNDFTTGMLTTFDDGNYSWGAYSITNSPDSFPNNTGKYAQIYVPGGIGAGDFAWYNGVRSINTNSVTWIPSAHLGDPLASYALKFEMNLRLPWNGASFYIVKDYSWTYLARFEPWKVSGAAVTTSGWVTVTIPLTQFTTKANGLDGTGVPAADLKTLVGSGSGALNFMLLNSDNTAAPAFDGAFDNFRIEKIQ